MELWNKMKKHSPTMFAHTTMWPTTYIRAPYTYMHKIGTTIYFFQPHTHVIQQLHYTLLTLFQWMKRFNACFTREPNPHARAQRSRRRTTSTRPPIGWTYTCSRYSYRMVAMVMHWTWRIPVRFRMRERFVWSLVLLFRNDYSLFW